MNNLLRSILGDEDYLNALVKEPVGRTAEGLASNVDLVNALLSHVGLGSEKPFLGTQHVREMFGLRPQEELPTATQRGLATSYGMLGPALLGGILSNPVSRAKLLQPLQSESGAFGKPAPRPTGIDPNTVVVRIGNRPIRVYHGTEETIEGALDPKKVFFGTHHDVGGISMSFTEQPRAASYYSGYRKPGKDWVIKTPIISSGTQPQIIPAFLNIKNVFDFEQPVTDELLDRVVNLAHDTLRSSEAKLVANYAESPISYSINSTETTTNRDLYSTLKSATGTHERVRKFLEGLGFDGIRLIEHDLEKPYITWQVFHKHQIIPALTGRE